jgi:hypothetical protein
MQFCQFFDNAFQVLFIITMIFQKVICYNNEYLLIEDAKPNQDIELFCEFVVTLIVITITKLNCSFSHILSYWQTLAYVLTFNKHYHTFEALVHFVILS